MNSFITLRQFRDKFSILSAREQLFLLAVVGVIIYFLFDGLVFSQQRIRYGELNASKKMAESQITVLRKAIIEVSKGSEVLAKFQAENEELKRQTEMMDVVINSLQGGAPQVGNIVRRVLLDYPRISIGSLKTVQFKSLLMPKIMAKSSQGTAAEVQQDIYKHGLEITVNGNYLDLLNYLKNLESRTQSVFWSDLKLQSSNYPMATLKVTIFILSNQPFLKIT